MASKASAKSTSEDKSFDFEAALEQLEKLVTDMEEGELSLEDSLKAFEKGVRLTRECQQALQKAELKVQQLIDESGNTQALDFDTEDGKQDS